MNTIQISQGIDADFAITLADDSGNPITSYTGAETLTSQVWMGEDQGVSFSPTCSWIDAPSGTIKLSVAASQTSSLTEGIYLARLTIGSGGRTVEAWRGKFRVLASPGTATTLPTYCSLQDMLLYAPDIQDSMSDTDETGFMRQRNLARQWLDRYIKGLWKGAKLAYYSPKYAGFSYIQSDNDPWLQSQLDLGYLMQDVRTKEIASKLAISYVYSSNLGGNPEQNSEYRKLAKDFEFQARQLCKVTRFSLDINGDGFPDMSIDGTTRDSRF